MSQTTARPLSKQRTPSNLKHPKAGDFRDLRLQKCDERMSRERKALSRARPNERFGLHFQELIENAGLTVAALRERLAAAKVDVTESGIRKWMRGERYPDHETMEVLGKILNLKDYRHVLPPAPRNS